MMQNSIKKLLPVLLYLMVLSGGFAQSVKLEPYWDSGLKFRSEDERYHFSVGGRVHLDFGYQQHGAVLDTTFQPIGDRIEIRRARVSFSGTLDNKVEYEFEFNFGETFDYGDMYVAFLQVPLVDRLTLGYLREPFGMEENINSNRLIFMERSLTNAFGTGRNVGLRLEKHLFSERFSTYAAINRLTENLADNDEKRNSQFSFSSRLTYSPLYKEEANRAVHLGMSGSTYRPLGKTFRIETQNETNVDVMYVQTPELENVRQVQRLGGEAGFTEGRLCLQAEYIHAFAQQAEQPGPNTRDFSSYYLKASYFIIGGIRKYHKRKNDFTTIDLDVRSEEDKLRGAWEVGARLSSINLHGTEDEFGKMKNLTLGMNWYFTSSSRLMLNVMRARIQREHTVHAVQFRAQVSF